MINIGKNEKVLTIQEDEQTFDLSFPLERTSAMKLLGMLWTGSGIGHIIVLSLLLIGLLFMGNQDFNLISIFFFFSFIIPCSFYLYRRMVLKGKKLMRKWCDVKLVDQSLHIKSGFPNTMDPNWQKINLKEVEEENRKIMLKGDNVGGYHLRINHDNEIYRMGLWLALEEANNGARDLSKLIGWQIVNLTREDKKTV